MIDTVVHRVLKIPHSLHIGHDSGGNRETPTVVFIHGLARTHHMWRQVVAQLEQQGVRCITVDLLGFGKSPKPVWQTYNADVQAASLRITLRKLGVRGPVILVGHSLGALVAAEFARIYPTRVSSLLLCSAPIYKSEPTRLFNRIKLVSTDQAYRAILTNLHTREAFTKRFNLYARKTKFIDEDFVVDDDNIVGVLGSIEMALVNQEAFEHILESTHKTILLYGRLDPYIIKKHFKTLAKHNKLCEVRTTLAGHEVIANKNYIAAIVEAVTDLVGPK